MDSPATPINTIIKVPHNFIRCPVCLVQYDITSALCKPIMLECHHSTCRTCVSSLISRVARSLPSVEDSYMGNRRVLICPICRARTRIPINGTNGLQENFYIVAILENLQDQHSATPVGINDNSGESSGETALKMWCETCEKVATIECESHSLKRVSEALEEMEETLNENLHRANGILAAQEEILFKGISRSVLEAKMEKLKNCLNLVTSLIQNRVVFLQMTKDWKQGLELTLSRLHVELQDIDSSKNCANVSSNETSAASLERQYSISRRSENKLERLQKVSEMLKKIGDIISTLRTLAPQPESRRQSCSEQLAQVVADLTQAIAL